MYQEYKTQYYIFNKKMDTSMYEALFCYDHQDPDHNRLSFTFLHWSLIYQIRLGNLKVN